MLCFIQFALFFVTCSFIFYLFWVCVNAILTMSLFRSLLVQSRSSIFNNIGLTLYSGFNTRIKILNNVKSYSALANSTISTSHKNHKEFVNEPGGYFLGLKASDIKLLIVF